MRTRILMLGLVAMLCGVAAGTVLLLQVRVHVAGVGASCGAPFDVISGRADWQAWYAGDLADPRPTAQAHLLRTNACPAAVNRRTTLAGALAGAATATAAAGFVISRRHRPRKRAAPLRTLGVWIAAVGVTLTVAGAIALTVLVANPSGALFLYIDRWAVAVVGLILLIPAIALASAGRALMIAAEPRERASTDASA